MSDLDGPGAAWGEFYVRHRRALTVYALSLAGNEADAADLVQDVLTNMVRRSCSPSDAKAFVMRALRNRAIDLRRRTAASRGLSDRSRLRAGGAGPDPERYGSVGGARRRGDRAGTAHEPKPSASIDVASASVEAREAAGEVRAALSRLSDEQREVVVLRVYADMTFREIAAALEWPLGTVTSHYARAIAALRAYLGSERGSGSDASVRRRQQPGVCSSAAIGAEGRHET